ncbi:MAG TPA: PQQ-binding-like beta-propeller repeat protein [Desulfosporosinus sp.]|nr:PQQ-binding-like beta-propeller repeat protein [Desulfosporosinus sp.]
MLIHIVQSGDTLYVISKRYNVSIQAIVDANNLANPDVLVVGQKLNIPVQAAMPTLQRGDRGTAVITLQEKLLSFGYNSGPVDGVFGGQTDSAVRNFQRDNGLITDGIVGPKTWAILSKVAPGPEPGVQKYSVQPNDTLAKIAVKFGVTVQTIVELNNISDPNMIYSGQELLIPKGPIAPTPPPPSPLPETGLGWLTLGKDNLYAHFESTNINLPLRSYQTIRTSPGTLTPLLTSDSIYVQAGTVTVAEIYAIDRATGQIRWSMRLGNGQALGTPAFRNGVVYCTGDKLRAISDNGNTGTLLWEADLRPIYSVTVAGDKIYVPATGPYSNAPNNTHALDAETGQLLWASSASNGPVAVSGNRIYLTWLERLYIIQDRGTTTETIATIGPLDGKLTSPVINGQIFVGSARGSLYSVNSLNGAILWKGSTESSIVASPAVDRERVYVIDQAQKLYAFDKYSGKVLWTYLLTTEAIPSGYQTPIPAIVGDKVFVPSASGQLIVLSAQTGAELWTAQGLDRFDRYAGGSPSAFNGMVALPGVYNVSTWISEV